jgi:hypothetical protein
MALIEASVGDLAARLGKRAVFLTFTHQAIALIWFGSV